MKILSNLIPEGNHYLVAVNTDKDELMNFYRIVRDNTTRDNCYTIYLEAKNCLTNVRSRYLFTKAFLSFVKDGLKLHDYKFIEDDYQDFILNYTGSELKLNKKRNKNKRITVSDVADVNLLKKMSWRKEVAIIHGIKWYSLPDNKGLTPHLLAASVEFDASVEEIKSVLSKRHFDISGLSENTSKLTPEMYIQLFKTYKPHYITPKQFESISRPVPKSFKSSELPNVEKATDVNAPQKQNEPKAKKTKKERKIVGVVKAPKKKKPQKPEVSKYNSEDYLRRLTKTVQNLRQRKPEELILVVQWEDVIFEDFQIKIKYGAHFSGPYLTSESRKSFKLLVKHLKAKNIPPLCVILKGNTITKVENLNELQNVFTFLRIKEDFYRQAAEGSPIDVRGLLSNLNMLPATFMEKVIRTKSVQDTIDYLCNRQDETLKIIPAFEIIPQGDTFREEDTFIFSITVGVYRCLVWESTIKGRATYLFLTSPAEYEKDIQRIFDYIASAQNAKRTKISGKDSAASDLPYLHRISHYSFERWKMELENLMSKI